jgi:hypothetical protein
VSFEISRSLRIVRRSLFHVLRSINLDHQSRVEAEEVQDISTVRHLPLELPTIHLPVA